MTTTSQGYESAEQELEAVRGWYRKASNDLAESESGRLDALAENARLRAALEPVLGGGGFAHEDNRAAIPYWAEWLKQSDGEGWALGEMLERIAALDAGKEGR